jgi:hypothetical protein
MLMRLLRFSHGVERQGKIIVRRPRVRSGFDRLGEQRFRLRKLLGLIRFRAALIQRLSLRRRPRSQRERHERFGLGFRTGDGRNQEADKNGELVPGHESPIRDDRH